MPPGNPLARISMTIPADLVRRADRLARQWDRSRSWVLAEGIRRLGDRPAEVDPAQALDEYRQGQLADDLRLSPEDRVIAAERTAREALTRSFGRLFVTFDRAEDYLAWKRLEAAGLL